MRIFFNLFVILSSSMLFSGCALPAALLWITQDPQENMDYSTEAEAEVEEVDLYPIGLYVESNDDEGAYYVYAGEYNSIRMSVPEGMYASDIVLSTTSGTIERSKEDSTLFILYVKEPNLSIEIVASNQVNEAKGLLYTETIELPMPKAGLKGIDMDEVKAEEFKKQGQLVLLYDESLLSLCKCNAFTLIHINNEGKKSIVNNESEVFNSETKGIISRAVKGDIYIFNDIKVNCTAYAQDKKTANLVYIIK
jgi:hypothetical protein